MSSSASQWQQRRSARGALRGIAGGLLWCSSAFADGQAPDRLTVRYTGPSTCSSAEAFVERVSPRLPGLTLVPTSEEATLEVRLSPEPEGVVASLTVLLADGGSLRRVIVAASCEEATEAIAFVASVALDPGADRPVRVRDARAGSASADDLGRPRESSPATPAAWEGAVGLGAAVNAGPAPEVLFQGLLYGRWGAEQPGWWSPAVRLELAYGRLGGYVAPGGVADFELLELAIDLCPLKGQWRSVQLAGCGLVSSGVMSAQGSADLENGSTNRLWLQTGGVVHLNFLLGQRFELSLRGVLGVPLIRDSFQFDELVFHQVPPVTGRLGLALGGRF